MRILPVGIQRSIVRHSKDLLIASNRTRLSRALGRRAYDLMRFVIRQRMGSVGGVRAMYLCHGLAQGECYPGLSDFDLAIVFSARDPLPFYERIRSVWGDLKRYFPINDLSILTADEFEAWQTMGGGWDPVDEVRHWKLLAGEDLRRRQHDPSTPAAALDRLQWALGHFQNLVYVALKEEPQAPAMAIVARRQLHKCFWNAVHGISPKYLSIGSRRARIDAWIAEHGDEEPIRTLQQMEAARFLRGPITSTRVSAAAFAARWLDEAIAGDPILARPLVRPSPCPGTPPIANAAEVDQRVQTMCVSLREMLEEKLACVMLSSTGTARGYALYIVLRDGLSAHEIGAGLRDIRAIHRVFDDPWFNEHFPAGVPTVCTEKMFVARLQTGRSSLDYFGSFRRVLYGRDLFLDATTSAVSPDLESRTEDWRREHLLYSLCLHQIYLAGVKPALHDYVTFYLPRLLLQGELNTAFPTAEAASAAFARQRHSADRLLPLRMLEQYRSKDLDALQKTMDRSVFSEVWPLVRQGLYPHADP